MELVCQYIQLYMNIITMPIGQYTSLYLLGELIFLLFDLFCLSSRDIINLIYLEIYSQIGSSL